jgi:hypothetical protein
MKFFAPSGVTEDCWSKKVKLQNQYYEVNDDLITSFYFLYGIISIEFKKINNNNTIVNFISCIFTFKKKSIVFSNYGNQSTTIKSNTQYMKEFTKNFLKNFIEGSTQKENKFNLKLVPSNYDFIRQLQYICMDPPKEQYVIDREVLKKGSTNSDFTILREYIKSNIQKTQEFVQFFNEMDNMKTNDRNMEKMSVLKEKMYRIKNNRSLMIIKGVEMNIHETNNLNYKMVNYFAESEEGMDEVYKEKIKEILKSKIFKKIVEEKERREEMERIKNEEIIVLGKYFF